MPSEKEAIKLQFTILERRFERLKEKMKEKGIILDKHS